MRKKRRSLTVPPETTPAVPEAETMQELIEKAKKRGTLNAQQELLALGAKGLLQ